MKKYGTLLSLYLAQSIPMSFFSTVVPVIMRQENYSLESIGLLQLIKLPWILKFLWAPFIDNTAKNRRGYRRIILISELIYAILIVSIGFLNLKTDFSTIIILVIVSFIASGTQDIATDAFAILSLKKSERSFGNSMQSAGSFLGTLVGSGVLLIIYHHYGWKILLSCLAVFALIAVIPLFSFSKKELEGREKSSVKRASLNDVGSFFRQKGIYRQVITLAIYYSGIIGVLAMVKPFLVDLGFRTDQIGFISGIYGTSMGALFALIAGYLVKKLSVKFTIRLFSFYNFVAAAGFLIMSFLTGNLALIYIFVCLLWSAYGMSTVAIYTMAMNIVRPGREGTDFTLQIVITHLSGLIVAVSSGKIAGAIGYKGLYTLETVIAALVFMTILFLHKDKKTENENTKDAIK
jgi:predicted MFS family arabinose efflux permease